MNKPLRFVVRSQMGIMADPGTHWVGTRYIDAALYDAAIEALRAIVAADDDGALSFDEIAAARELLPEFMLQHDGSGAPESQGIEVPDSSTSQKDPS